MEILGETKNRLFNNASSPEWIRGRINEVNLGSIMLSERKISKIVYNMILKTAKHLLVTGVSTFKGCSLGKGDSCLEEAK